MKNIKGMKNENELIRLIMLLSDTQAWLNDLCFQSITNVHASGIKLMNSKTYRLTITSFAHIIQRHYYKTLRHPNTGKFIISLPEILDHLKAAGTIEAKAMKGSVNFKRCLELKETIGFDKDGADAHSMIVITDQSGNIITAYPE